MYIEDVPPFCNTSNASNFHFREKSSLIENAKEDTKTKSQVISHCLIVIKIPE